MPEPEKDQISALRSLAHPVRLRILSLLTAEAMSAAEVARALDISHANASYHLKVLHEAGELVEAGSERIRGGTARRFRYDVERGLGDRSRTTTTVERLADARATALEIERRLQSRAPGASYSSDLEAWVTREDWVRALELVHEASALLHAAARRPGTPDTVHVSVTSTAFTMEGGLTGDAVRWRP